MLPSDVILKTREYKQYLRKLELEKSVSSTTRSLYIDYYKDSVRRWEKFQTLKNSRKFWKPRTGENSTIDDQWQFLLVYLTVAWFSCICVSVLIMISLSTRYSPLALVMAGLILAVFTTGLSIAIVRQMKNDYWKMLDDLIEFEETFLDDVIQSLDKK